MYSLLKEANEFKEKHGAEATHLMLDCRIIKTAFYVVDCAIKEKENVSNYLCGRKFNLMCLLYAYAPLLSHKKITDFHKLDANEIIEIKSELINWKEWHGYDEMRMLRIVYVANYIAEAILNYYENKIPFTIP